MSVPLTTPRGGEPMYPPAYPQQPYWAPPSPPPRRKSNTGLIVGVVVALTLVVCGAGAALLYAIGSNLTTQAPGTAITQTTVAPSTQTSATPSTVAYQNSLTTGASGWSNDQHCFPGNDGYHIKDGYICYAPAGNQAGVDIRVSVSQPSGSTLYGHGIAFRRTAHVDNGYDFLIDSNSKWVFFKCGQNNCTRLVDFTPNAAIHGGLNATNTLEVRAVGSHFEFFVNGVNVGHADDATYTTGLVGLEAGTGTECIFQNLTIARVG